MEGTKMALRPYAFSPAPRLQVISSCMLSVRSHKGQMQGDFKKHLYSATVRDPYFNTRY